MSFSFSSSSPSSFKLNKRFLILILLKFKLVLEESLIRTNEVLGNIPLGRFAELSDVATAAVFLASDAASMVHGTSLLVDGGWTAK